MGIIGEPRVFFEGFKWRFEIDGMSGLEFSKCSELKSEIGVIEHAQGGALTPEQLPGKVKFSPLTLEFGATKDLTIYKWFEEGVRMAAGVGGTGLTAPKLRRNADLVQLDRSDVVVQRWRIYQAWCTTFVAGEWDNNAENIVISKATIAYRYYEPMMNR